MSEREELRSAKKKLNFLNNTPGIDDLLEDMMNQAILDYDIHDFMAGPLTLKMVIDRVKAGYIDTIERLTPKQSIQGNLFGEY